jgi:PAS domain S-box-containing protein
VAGDRGSTTGTLRWRGGPGGGGSSGRLGTYVVPVLVFVILALVASLVGLLVYQRQARDVRISTGQQLTVVRVLKTTDLATWQADQRSDAEILAGDPVLSENIERWIKAGQTLPAPFVVRSLVRTYQAMHGYQRLTILDPSLHSVYGSPSGLPRVGQFTRRLATQAMAQDRVVFSDLFIDGRGDLALQYVAPIRDATPSPDRVLGAYVVRLDPATTIFPLLRSWPTTSQTAETLLVERRGNDVLYLNAPRQGGDGALVVTRPLSQANLPAAMALKGRTGIVEGVDYRGKPVEASVGPVPGTPWHLVAKIDQKEVSATLRTSALVTFGAVVGVILLGGLLLIVFWGVRESRQVRRLYEAERSLRASERHFEMAFENAPLGVSFTRLDGTLSRVNSALAGMLGYTCDELNGRSVGELTHPDDRDETAREMQATVAGQQERFRLDKRYLRKDGSSLWTTASVTLLRREDGTPDHFVAMIEDISAQRVDAERLARLTLLYRMLSSVDEVIVRASGTETLYEEICRTLVATGGFAGAWVAVLDEEGREQAAASCGLGEDLVDRAGVGLEDSEHGLSPTSVALRRGRTDTCREVQEDPRTAPWHDVFARLGIHSVAALPVLVRGAPVAAIVVYAAQPDAFDAEELELFEQLAADVAFAVEMFSAEEARAQAERDLARLNRELEQRVLERTSELEASNRELEAFSYSVSHDLRAPLRALDGFSLALLEDYNDALDETAQDYLARVRAASQRMGLLIDDLLTLSRVTRRDMVREPVDLTELARDVIADLRESSPGRQVEVTMPDEMRAAGDPALLRVVVQNLLANAWKFTGRREVAHIEFGEEDADGVPAYFVRDDGAGFDQSYADKLFTPFQRLHSADEFPGTGVGLATAERIIHRHGGTMWARGAVDSGATFFFTLV